MVTKLPVKILNYMIDNIPPFAGIFIIHTDSSGKVRKWFGSPNRFLSGDEISNKRYITDLYPILEGLIPPPGTDFQLPNIQLPDNVYTDIHIFKENEDNIWVFFMERTQDVESIRQLIQSMNETQLQLEKKQREAENRFCFENPFGRLDLINAVAFVKNSDGTFTLQSKVTTWLTTLYPVMGEKKKNIRIAEYFPFLELFIKEAQNHWDSGSEKFFNSDTWIEETGVGNEFLLKAGAISYGGKNYLILRLLNSDLSEGQQVIQKAREQELLYEQLNKTKDKLKQLLEYKERFVSIVSHDLRSPVASVLGITEMLLNDDDFLNKLDDFNKEMVIGIHDEMQRLLDYNDKLYHWSNLELGNFEIDRKEADLNDLVGKSYKTVKARLSEKNITFENKVPEFLVVSVDITLFLQVLNNLLSNAVKFTGKGGKIVASAVQKDNLINLSISDTGTGMAEHTAKTLFDDDLRTSSPGTYGEKGSGLGIGIIKKILDAHNFKIKVNSVKGEGTTFTITLPAAK